MRAYLSTSENFRDLDFHFVDRRWMAVFDDPSTDALICSNFQSVFYFSFDKIDGFLFDCHTAFLFFFQ